MELFRACCASPYSACSGAPSLRQRLPLASHLQACAKDDQETKDESQRKLKMAAVDDKAVPYEAPFDWLYFGLQTMWGLLVIQMCITGLTSCLVIIAICRGERVVTVFESIRALGKERVFLNKQPAQAGPALTF